jgi:DNA-directed RNA polymerase II subunit RPB2
MTSSQLIETVIGKKICIKGENTKPNATAFEERNIEEIGDELVKHGFNRYGYERMINGITGEMMESLVFIGPTYYQRLKHMVKDKIHSRGNGSTQNLNRQPTEGRSRGGGLRVGEKRLKKICLQK